MPDLSLFVTDVDRTLLTHDYAIPARVSAALRSLVDAGVTVVLASARSPAALRPYAERLGVADLAICFNGGWIGNVATGASIHQAPIERAAALAAMIAAQAEGTNPMWFTATGIHALEITESIRREAAITGEALHVAADPAELPGEPGKIMCVAANPADAAGFQRLRERLGSGLSVASSHTRLLEIGPLQVSKRSAIETIAKRLNIAPAQCAAAGDAENDIEMLKWAGAAVTVANALSAVKRLAAFVGPSCDQGGLADGIAWLLARQAHARAAV
jgi:Cof subfamily protein (haloacid dehalogenase superfamily)